MSPRTGVLLCLALWCFACRPREGVPVESVAAGGAGARAGLQAGDVLLSYRRRAAPPAAPRDAAGRLSSCRDLAQAEIEQAPRGPVELSARRAGTVRTFEMPPGEWKIELRPGGDAGCAAFARARRAAGARRWSEAAAGFAAVAGQAERQGERLFAALALQEQGLAGLGGEAFADAETAFTAALRLRREAAPGSLAEAASWHAAGRAARRLGAFDRSDAAFRQALALWTRLAPVSLERAWTLNLLGLNASSLGDFAAAERLHEQALALIRRRAPGSLEEAQVLNNLGLLARSLGETEVARRRFAAAIRIGERLDPAGLDLARARTNLGLIALGRGDLAEAEEVLRAALERFEQEGPENVEVAYTLNALGEVARERMETAEADALFRRALAIRSRILPGSFDEAQSLMSLAGIANDQKNLDEAERFARRAFSIRTRLAPDGQEAVSSLTMLGAIAQNRGDLAGAAALSERALARQRKLAPGAAFEGEILFLLGGIEVDRKGWQRAETYLDQVLALRRRLEPASRAEAETLNLLALVYEGTGRHAAAGAALATAVDALEAQAGRLGGSDEARSAFQAGVSRIYGNYVELQVERGKGAAALHTVERSRARSLLALLAQRDLAFRADVPAPLLDRQRRLEREYDVVQGDVAKTDPHDAAGLDALLARLARLRGERASLDGSIIRASPRYASLRYPRPLDLDGVRGALDPGTVLLSYCVTDEDTFLFVVTPDREPLRVVRLPAGRARLEEEVEIFRSLLLRGKDAAEAEEALLDRGRKLYALLVAPADPEIAGAARVLISPDGPLLTLPFAALVRPGTQVAPAPPPYLAAWKPLHTVLSATLYAELRRGRRERRAAGPLVVFAEPKFRTAPAGPSDERRSPLALYRRGLPPLPGAGEEAQSLSRLYGQAAHVYIGMQATEERAKHLPVAPRIFHLATHALLDRRSPLDSALALALPRPGERENGLLQAWEIFEQVRLDSDLVTLSACETGLGKEAAGEGLIGLTRAFQYAGARSVLASLWAVSDRSTAKLMTRFYTLLRAGRPKDAALAEAQKALFAEGGAFAHPYHWAAFELTGDWR